MTLRSCAADAGRRYWELSKLVLRADRKDPPEAAELAAVRRFLESVAAPIEEQVNGVENMIYMDSKSDSEGQFNLTVSFEIGSDVVAAGATKISRACADPASSSTTAPVIVQDLMASCSFLE